MDAINKKLEEHDAKICKLEKNDMEYEKFMIETNLRYAHLEKAITKKAEFWDKIKVSITTSVILFFIMWIFNNSTVFKP